ncbi:MAG: ABC transporter ATP-binding protein [Flavobacteriales bacterium]
MADILRTEALSKSYGEGRSQLEVLKGIDLELAAGGSMAIVGPSGSGKTTLLGLCAGLDRPSSGKVLIGGKDIGPLSEDERARLRSQRIGFIFQDFRLMPTLTALENVMVPIELQGGETPEDRAEECLERVGLQDRLGHYPNELSGGEQQRVSIARAFSNRPQLLFADEPTGNLDEETGKKVEDFLFGLEREENTALVLVTHDRELAARTEKEMHLKGGRVVR